MNGVANFNPMGKVRVLLGLMLILLNAEQAFAQSEPGMTNPVFSFSEQMPEASYAVDSFLAKAIVVPELSPVKEGRVYVNFIVREDGAISHVEIAKSITPLLDAEAVRVIKTMPPWKPGRQAGMAVPVKIMMPVWFKPGMRVGTPPPDTAKPHPIDFKILAEGDKQRIAIRSSSMAKEVGTEIFEKTGYVWGDGAIFKMKGGKVTNVPISIDAHIGVLLVLPKRKAVVRSSFYDGGLRFADAPLGEQGYVLFIRQEEVGEEKRYATQDVVVGSDAVVEPKEWKVLDEAAKKGLRGRG